MIPVGYVEATSTMHLAFGDSVDHSLLYAVEKMTGMHTEPCLAPAGFVRASLRTLPHRGEDEVCFERLRDTAECCRIIRNYSARVSASEARIAGCGPYVWVRLFRASHAPMDLLFRSSDAASLSSHGD